MEPLTFTLSVLIECFTRLYGGRGRIAKLVTNRSPQFHLAEIVRKSLQRQRIIAIAGIACLTSNTPLAANAVEQSGTSKPSQSPQQPQPEPRRIYIQKYRVQGAHLLTKLEVEEAVYPYLGPERTSEDVDQARAALEKAYQAKGYQTVSVQVPPQ